MGRSAPSQELCKRTRSASWHTMWLPARTIPDAGYKGSTAFSFCGDLGAHAPAASPTGVSLCSHTTCRCVADRCARVFPESSGTARGNRDLRGPVRHLAQQASESAARSACVGRPAIAGLSSSGASFGNARKKTAAPAAPARMPRIVPERELILKPTSSTSM